MKNKKGSISMGGLGLLFLELAVFVAFLPNINQLINDALPYLAENVIAVWILRLLPLAIVMALTLSVFKKDEQMLYL